MTGRARANRPASTIQAGPPTRPRGRRSGGVIQAIGTGRGCGHGTKGLHATLAEGYWADGSPPAYRVGGPDPTDNGGGDSPKRTCLGLWGNESSFVSGLCRTMPDEGGTTVRLAHDDMKRDLSGFSGTVRVHSSGYGASGGPVGADRRGRKQS